MPLVTFVVPTFRRPEALAATLDAIFAVDHPHEQTRVVVVDDADDPATEAIVTACDNGGVDVRYLRQENSGVAGARNRGAVEASEGLLIFVDDDILIERDHVRRHLAARAETAGSLINGHWEFAPGMEQELRKTPFGRFRMEVENWVRARIPKTAIDETRAYVPTATACNLSIDAADFHMLGGFDEAFPYAGCEDQELSLRANARGLKMVYDRSIRLLHNDRRLNLIEFCERQRRGAITAVVLASMHLGTARGQPMIVENAPNRSWRRPRRAVKRTVKRGLASRPGLLTARWSVAAGERLVPRSRLLRRAYWSMTGIYIFIGVRQGFNLLNPRDRERLLAVIAGA